jgi:hypothetical protein
MGQQDWSLLYDSSEQLDDAFFKTLPPVGKLGGYSVIKARAKASSLEQDVKIAILLEIRQRSRSYERSLSQKQRQGRTQKY